LNDHASYEHRTAPELRHSIGARLSGTPSHVDYNVELVYQFGSFGDGGIRAWTFASDTGYPFTSAPWRPRLGTQANATSGDKDPRDLDLETFNPLFPRGSYFSEAALIGPLNHIDLHPAVDVNPTASCRARP
jgi:Alginate export